MILKTFADESSDGTLYVVGGYITSIDLWDRVSQNWGDILGEDPKTQYYSTNDALGFKGPFTGWTANARDGKMARLASSLPTVDFWGVCSYLNQRDFDELWHQGKFQKIYDDPYHLCALYLAEKICESFSHQATRIDFIFDEKGQIGRRFEQVFNALVRPILVDRYPCCGKIYPEDDKGFPPLQAADMNAAWMCRKTSPKIQRWTAADVYLERIPQVSPYAVKREWLEKLVAFSVQHEQEIKAFAEIVEKEDNWLEQLRSKAKGSP